MTSFLFIFTFFLFISTFSGTKLWRKEGLAASVWFQTEYGREGKLRSLLCRKM